MVMIADLFAVVASAAVVPYEAWTPRPPLPMDSRRSTASTTSSSR
jgi:hypothetical protein